MNDQSVAPDPVQQVQQLTAQQHVDREVRMVIGDLAMSAVFARARAAELEAALAAMAQQLAAKDQQIAALSAGKPKVVKEAG